MPPGCVYAHRQIQTWHAGSGLSCRRRLASNPRRGAHRPLSSAHRAAAHPGFSMPFASVPRVRGSFILKSGDSRPNSAEAGIRITVVCSNEKVGSRKC